jgi:spore coat polysaccharide biosynthesis protein SpsF
LKSGILLLARSGATRLPGKLLLKVLGRPILEYQLERLKTARRPDCFVLCTTQLAEDEALIDLASQNGLQTFRGNTEDVVDRMIQGAREYQLDFIVSIGGDDLFIDPVLVDLIIERFVRTSADFIYCSDLPVGGTPFGVKTRALERLAQIKTGGTDGWERYFKETGLFQVEVIPPPDQILRRPELRMTLDYQEDFLFFKAVIEELYPQKGIFLLKDVITLMDNRPDIAELAQKRAAEWHTKHATFDIAIRADLAHEGNKESAATLKKGE